jgi:hypothetical protein
MTAASRNALAIEIQVSYAAIGQTAAVPLGFTSTAPIDAAPKITVAHDHIASFERNNKAARCGLALGAGEAVFGGRANS